MAGVQDEGLQSGGLGKYRFVLLASDSLSVKQEMGEIMCNDSFSTADEQGGALGMLGW